MNDWRYTGQHCINCGAKLLARPSSSSCCKGMDYKHDNVSCTHPLPFSNWEQYKLWEKAGEN